MSDGKRFSLDDYIDVSERIQNFNDRYPDGSLQQIGWEVRTVADKTFIVYTAAAFRTPDDPRPGMGTAWEPFPGTTNYTRNSELMNAETAAWGRAIVALGLTANRKIASKQEVKARREEQWTGSPAASDATVTPPWERPAEPVESTVEPQGALVDPMPADELMAEIRRQGGMKVDAFRDLLRSVNVEPSDQLASADARRNFLANLPADRRVALAQALVSRDKLHREALQEERRVRGD